MSEPFRVLVTGSRSWGDENRHVIRDRLARLAVDHPDEQIVIVHGACSRRDRHGVEQSADMLADSIARTLRLDVERHPADWRVTPDTPEWAVRHRRDGTPYDVRAGALRNDRMLDSGIGLVLAFRRSSSRGTNHAIQGARRRRIPVEVTTMDAQGSIYRAREGCPS